MEPWGKKEKLKFLKRELENYVVRSKKIIHGLTSAYEMPLYFGN